MILVCQKKSFSITLQRKIMFSDMLSSSRLMVFYWQRTRRILEFSFGNNTSLFFFLNQIPPATFGLPCQQTQAFCPDKNRLGKNILFNTFASLLTLV